VFGDLDISILDELPKGRRQIQTKIFSPQERAKVYKLILEQLKLGRQGYVVTPLIEEDSQNSTSGNVEKIAAETKFKEISKVYKLFRVGLLHGKMPPAEKDKVMRDFAEQKVDILVATTVIEVGVDVPNATVMLIENADQFGLAQLHQLRGRVGRSQHQSYCFLITSENKPPTRRLREIEKSGDGFYLSEVDLKLRGPGQIYGTAQHGELNLQIADLADSRLIARAAQAADDFIAAKTDLAEFSTLQANVRKYQRLTTLN
jgi:ATP-dependent DNA helicase RecG